VDSCLADSDSATFLAPDGTLAGVNEEHFDRRVVLYEHPSVINDLELLALERGCSRSDVIRAIIREHLERVESERRSRRG
jgi:Ribbon-helix-helix protein, copG family